MKLLPEDLAFLKGLPVFQRHRIPGIRLDIVAEKLRALRASDYPEAARQLEENPRLAEMLLFIQWASQQSGGLETFTRNHLLAEFPEIIGTPELHTAEASREGTFRRLQELLAVWESIPVRHRRWPRSLSARHQDSFNLWLMEDEKHLRAIEREAGPHYREILAVLTPQYFWRACAAATLELLPPYLASLCNEISKPFQPPHQSDESLEYIADMAFAVGCRRAEEEPRPIPEWRSTVSRTRREVWRANDLVDSFLSMMDRHAARVRASIAQTQVALAIFDELDFSIQSGVPVFIAGDSRYGKTFAHKAWCEAYPGRARLIGTPSTGGAWAFYIAHADALGLVYNNRTNQRGLALDVQFTIKHSGLFLCYDESHFLLPAKVSKSSKPWRMDWVRCHVVDCDRGAAFIATRQTYGQSLAQFVKVTHYQMEQWIDRMHRPLLLPSELSRQDVLAVAAHNFPAFPKAQLEAIAAEALGEDSPHHVVKLLAKISEHRARKAGRATPTGEDVRQAIAEWKSRPSQKAFENPHVAPAAPKQKGTLASSPDQTKPTPLQPASKRIADTMQAASRREISPVNSVPKQLARSAPNAEPAGVS